MENMFHSYTISNLHDVFVQETSMEIITLRQAMKKNRSLKYPKKWEPYAPSTVQVSVGISTSLLSKQLAIDLDGWSLM